MSQELQRAQSLFEVGNLYREKCSLRLAIEKLREASDAYYKLRDIPMFMRCENYLLRMYAERGDTENINRTKEKLQDLVIREGFQLSSKVYYTLGISATYKDQYDVALEYFQRALSLALGEDNKEDMCYAIHGLAVVYFNMGRHGEALKEIYNLQVFFDFLDLAELKISSQILNGIILRELERYDQALEILWSCYESLKERKQLILHLDLLYALGRTYQKAGNQELAAVYLELAKKSVDPNEMVETARHIDERLKELGVQSKEDFDLVLDEKRNMVFERRKGSIDFRNQFILMDLLHLFLKSPGRVFSKEELVRKIWTEDYDPSVHDNKIYVTIKRLRKMIEPDVDNPKYIYRSKSGYYLNKSARVLLEH